MTEEVRQELLKRVRDSMKGWVDQARAVMKGTDILDSELLFKQQLELYSIVQAIYPLLDGEGRAPNVPVVMREVNGKEFMILDYPEELGQALDNPEKWPAFPRIEDEGNQGNDLAD